MPVTIEEGALPVIDIGSGVQIETTHQKAMQMLGERNSELTNLIERLVEESKAIESTISQLTSEIEINEPEIKSENPKPTQDQEPSHNQPKKRSQRRKRRTELTLDD